MVGWWVRVVVASSTVAAGTFVAGCASDRPAVVETKVADARVSRVTRPGPPLGLQIVSDEGSCVASWRAPVDDGGTPVTGYVVTTESKTRGVDGIDGAHPDLGTAATARQAPGPPVSIDRTPGVLQTVRVFAHSAAGDGPTGDAATC
jgi:hypothetical protein